MSATDLANGLASAPYLRQGGLEVEARMRMKEAGFNQWVGVGAALYGKRREVEDG